MDQSKKRKQEVIEVAYSGGSKLSGTFTNGYLTQGQCINGRCKAVGSFIIPDTHNEKAVITFNDGSVVENNVTDSLFKNEYACGILKKGKVSGDHTDTYEGEFGENGLINGKITNSFREINGSFINGQLTKGSVLYTSGLRVEGTFENGLIKEGFVLTPDGVREEGFFTDSRLVKGTITHKNGYKESGSFEKNQIINGEINYPNGYIEKGTFEHGRLVSGKKIYPDGSVDEGNFDCDRLINDI